MAGNTVDLGNLQARLTMDKSGFDKGLSGANTGIGGLSSKISALAVPIAAVGVALVGLGAASLSAWTEIDESLDNIRVGTGATGEALAGLEDSFKAVFSSVPVDAADASTAIADLNTRLGLTGDGLETLATQFLELSRITGTNVGSNIKSVTRLFGDWSVATEDQADTLDYLFKTAQATGATVEQLATTATAYGTSLRGLGFDMETSIALLGKFEKEGVNTETIMGSLKIGMANMAKQGFHNADEAMEELIRQIKEFPDAMDATATSIEIFGSRSAADFTMAVREGRFEVDDFISTLSDSDETILKAADDTRDFAEQFKVLNNKITLALEPLGAMLAGIISTDIIPALDSIMEWWKGDGSDMLNNVGGLFQWLIDTFQPLVDLYRGFWEGQAQKMTEFWEEDGALVMAAMENIMNGVKLLVETIVALWEYVWPYMETVAGGAFDVLLDIVGVFAALFAGDWDALGDKLFDLSLSVFDLLYSVFEIGFDALLWVFTEFGNAVGGIITDIMNAVVQTIEDAINSVIEMINSVIQTVNDVTGTSFGLIGEVSFGEFTAPTFEAPTLSGLTGVVKPSETIRTALANAEGEGGGGTTITQNITVNNPEPEPISKTTKTIQRDLASQAAGV